MNGKSCSKTNVSDITMSLYICSIERTESSGMDLSFKYVSILKYLIFLVSFMMSENSFCPKMEGMEHDGVTGGPNGALLVDCGITEEDEVSFGSVLKSIP